MTVSLFLRLLVVQRRHRSLQRERASRELAALEAQRMAATAAKHLRRERDDARARLQEADARWRALWNAPVALVLLDGTGRVSDANVAAGKLGIVQGKALPDRAEWTTPTGATVAGARLAWRDAEGDSRALALLTDATTLHRSEHERAEAEERAQRLAETAFEGIAVLEGGAIVECNATFARLLGVLPHEVLGMRATELGLDLPHDNRPCATTLAGAPVEALVRDAHLHGKEARILSVRDVGALRHAEAEARRLRKLALDTAAALRNEEIVMEPYGRDRIVRTLEDAARVEAGRAEPVDMNSVADVVLRGVTAPGIRVHKEFLSSSAAFVDRVEVSEVLAALVRHACDAMAEQGQGDLTILTMDTPERVVVEVTDTAPAARASAPVWGGVPRHLTSGHRILDARGGKLSFLALPGTGATFRLEVPLAPAAARGNG